MFSNRLQISAETVGHGILGYLLIEPYFGPDSLFFSHPPLTLLSVAGLTIPILIIAEALLVPKESFPLYTDQLEGARSKIMTDKVTYTSRKATVDKVSSHQGVGVITRWCPREDIDHYQLSHRSRTNKLVSRTIDTSQSGPRLDVDGVVPDGTEGCAENDDTPISRVGDDVALDQTGLTGETDTVGPLPGSVTIYTSRI